MVGRKKKIIASLLRWRQIIITFYVLDTSWFYVDINIMGFLEKLYYYINTEVGSKRPTHAYVAKILIDIQLYDKSNK